MTNHARPLPRLRRLRSLPLLSMLAVLAIAVVAGACAGGAGSGGGTPVPDTSASPTATATPPAGAGPTTTPSPSTGAPGSGVFVDAADVLLLESYPVQVVLHVRGDLPTPCHQLVTDVTDDGTRIDVTLTGVSSAEGCAQVLEPFEERIALGSYAAGAREVWVNGEHVGKFDLGASGGDLSATPGVAFTLRPGMTATLEDDGTRIRFDGVEDDSRCPRDVQCIRAGDATVVLTVTLLTGTEQNVRVLVEPSEGEATVDGLRIRVTALAPTPVSTAPIAPGDYEATLVVER